MKRIGSDNSRVITVLMDSVVSSRYTHDDRPSPGGAPMVGFYT